MMKMKNEDEDEDIITRSTTGNQILWETWQISLF